MTTGGWIFMIVAVTAATTFFGWCLNKVLRNPSTGEHIHSQADIEPPDAKRG